MKIRIAQLSDFKLLKNYDKHISKDNLVKQIENNNIMIAEEDDILLGWLRFNLFWDSIPFIDMLFLYDIEFVKFLKGRG